MLMLSKYRKHFINIFIVFNILAVLFASSDVIPRIEAWYNLTYPYLRWTRLAQSWFLFPDPRREAMKFHVEIEFKDKTMTKWARPSSPKWDFFGRHLAYNYQKIDSAGPSLYRVPEVQKDFASYAMRLHWNEANPPEKVVLVMSTARWPPPRDGAIIYDESKLVWIERVLGTYQVVGGKLQ